MKSSKKAIKISAALIIGILSLVYFATFFSYDMLDLKSLITFSLFLVLTLAYIYSIWFMLKDVRLGEKAQLFIIVLNVLVVLFIVFFFNDVNGLELLQDALYYQFGIGIRYVQSRLFIVLVPALIGYIFGLMGHIMLKKIHNAKKPLPLGSCKCAQGA